MKLLRSHFIEDTKLEDSMEERGPMGPATFRCDWTVSSPSTPDIILLYQVPTGHVTRLNVHFTLVIPPHAGAVVLHSGT